mgnify:CR=1 FL=1|tara:strand:- start:30760 stop:31431 length:672 start_codon:yes stop_codon:yes gene_type:complete
MATSLELSRTYTSFSGVDIRAVVDGEPIGQLQAISYAVQREKAPIYVMGRVDPLSFSRGKRGIAGTLISLLLDQHILFGKAFGDMNFLADKDEIYADPADLTSVTSMDDLGAVEDVPFSASDLGDNFTVTGAWYVDQLPPFDVTIVAANEYGKAATMRIYGVEILNEGSGFSIDDIVIENQMTYVCRTILPWQRMGHWDLSVDGSSMSTVSPSSVTSSTLIPI